MRNYYEEVKHLFTVDGLSKYIDDYVSPKTSSDEIESILFKGESTLYFEIEEAGFGAMLSRIMTGVGIATHFGYSMSYRMAGCKYHCPFEISSVPVNGQRTTFDFTKKQDPVQEWQFSPYYYKQENNAIRAKYQYPSCPYPEMGYNNHQWCARILKYLVSRPEAEFTEYLQKTKERLQWDKYPVKIGLHIRRGDKNVESEHLKTSVYLNYLHRLIKKYDLKNPCIFVATDDPSVYPEVRMLLGFKGINVIGDEQEFRLNGDNVKFIKENPDKIKTESYTMAKTILLLGDCDYVLGTHNAQATWLGGLLCVSKNNYDTDRHYMIDAKQPERLSHWASDYLGYNHETCQPPTLP
jgi:hypothetical protein